MKWSSVLFLTADEVVRINADAIAAAGGEHGVLNRGLLESAVAKPQTVLYGEVMYPTLASMAAVLGWTLAKNHAFRDGNKRTGFMAAKAFLLLNGCRYVQEQPDWTSIYVAVADGSSGYADLSLTYSLHVSDSDEPVELD